MDLESRWSNNHFVGVFWVINTAQRDEVVIPFLVSLRTADWSEEFEIAHGHLSARAAWQAFRSHEAIEDDVLSALIVSEPNEWPDGRVEYWLSKDRFVIAMDKRLENKVGVLSQIQSMFNISPSDCIITYNS